jgi:uncharacterized protein YcfL
MRFLSFLMILSLIVLVGCESKTTPATLSAEELAKQKADAAAVDDAENAMQKDSKTKKR